MPTSPTIRGSATAQIKVLARSWPSRFDRVMGGPRVASAGAHRFDGFSTPGRLVRLLDRAHSSRRAVLHLRCECTLDRLGEAEISVTRG